MKLEHFNFLLEINRLHSISAAARSLHIGQTRLSAIVKSVEGELGFAIFQRTPKGVIATPTGELLMALAWEINIKYEDLMSLKSRSSMGAPDITVLLSPSIALRAAIPVARQYYRYALPGNLRFDERPSRSIQELIVKNAANVGIAYLNDEELRRLESGETPSPLQIERLLEDEIYLLVSKEHRFADREYIEPQETRGERMARPRRLNDDMVLGEIRALSDHVTGFTSMDIMCQAILEQGMVGLVPGFLGGSDSVIGADRFRFIPLRVMDRENIAHIRLLTYKGRSMLHQERILVLCIREYFRELRKSRLNPAGGAKL